MQHDQKFKTKIQISWEQKEPLRWNKKHFSSFSKDFKLPKIVSDMRVRLKCFLVFNTHYIRNLHRALASSVYNVGKIGKILRCFFDFKMSVVHCSWNCLLTFIYFGESQRWSKCFEKLSGKEYFSARVFLLLILTIMVQHDKVYF